jgi:hypothetical protein
MVEGRLLPCNQVSISQFILSCQDLCQRVLQLRLLPEALRRCNTRPHRHMTAHDPCTARRDLRILSILRLSMAMFNRVLVLRLRWHHPLVLVLKTSMRSTNLTTLTRANMTAMVNTRASTLTPLLHTVDAKPHTLACPTHLWAKCTRILRTYLLR